jgi:hypothetical protein
MSSELDRLANFIREEMKKDEPKAVSLDEKKKKYSKEPKDTEEEASKRNSNKKTEDKINKKAVKK